MKEIWRKVKSVRGIPNTKKIPGLRTEQTILTAPNEIAETLAKHFYKISACNTLAPRNWRNESMPISYDHEGNYNVPLAIHELEHQLNKLPKKSATGTDGISYEMLNNLPEEGRQLLLQLYNRVWDTGYLPKIWRHSLIIPIPKKEKGCLVTDFRPISLLSCFSKIQEKIVNQRLTEVIKKRDLLTPYQFGFREQHSTIDPIQMLKWEAQEAFQKKQHLIAVFLDVEKAYDTMWRWRVLETLKRWNITGNLWNYIKNFLSDRTFSVMVGTSESSVYTMENGTPQGSPLSVTLFQIAINDIINACIKPTITILYADDILLLTRSKSINFLEWKMQETLDSIDSWS